MVNADVFYSFCCLLSPQSTFVISAICRLSCAFFKDDIQLFAIALCSTSVFYAAVTSLLDSIVVSSLDPKERLNFGKLRLWGELGNGISSTLSKC